MKAIHGRKAKNDKIDSHKIGVLLRGGMLPQAYVYPAAMRSTRDLLAHIRNTRAQDNLPAFERRLAYPANRDGVVEHVPDPIVREAKRHDGDAFHRLKSVPGTGKILTLTILYEGVGCRGNDVAPDLETKTAATENATGLELNGRAWAYEHDRTEKICALDLERVDRGQASPR